MEIKSSRIIIGVLSLAFAILFQSVHAEIINIPSDYRSFDNAINAAERGDTILVHPGTYVENVDFVGKEIILGSLYIITGDTTYVDSTIIEGEGDGTVVSIIDVEGANTALVGFTILNGDAELGGGVKCINSRPTIRRCKITENTGGGLNSTDSRTTLINCNIINNSVRRWNESGVQCFRGFININNCIVSGNGRRHDDQLGGGILISESDDSEITNCIVNNNNAGTGGGIFIDRSNVYIENTLVRYNYSTNHGGGIHCYSYDSILRNCIINENTADGVGGGICFTNSTATVQQCKIQLNRSRSGGGILCSSSSIFLLESNISGNEVTEDGAGISCEEASSTTFRRCIISINDGMKGGGVFCSRRSESNIFKCTISNNSAHYGGSIYCEYASTSNIINSILLNNSNEEVYFSWENESNNIILQYSDIRNGEDGIEANDNGEVQWGDGNINADPMFVHAENGDFRLNNGSPCIDAGIEHGDEYFGEAPDMGAIEFCNDGVIDSFISISPESICLLLAYPNPFNSTTTINFYLPRSGIVKLDLYDILGHRVRELTPDRWFEQGEHRVALDGEGLSSGVYVLKLNRKAQYVNLVR